MAKVSIVVPVYNAERTIEKCLESLIKQSFPDYEIIIVDNGSNDGSFALIEEFIKAHPKKKIRLIKEEKKGPSNARNRGIKDSSGDIVAFTDSDCVTDRKWLEDIIKAFDNEEIGAVAGNIRGYKPSNLIEKFLSIFTLRGLKETQVVKAFSLIKGGFPTANLVVRRDVLVEIGGFNEEMEIYGEDYDLCARIYMEGYRIKYIDSAVIYHIHRNSLSGLIKQSFGFGNGHSSLLRKHFCKKVIIELPRMTIERNDIPLRLWLNLSSADKKVAFLSLIGFFYYPLFGLLLFYLFYLYLDITRRVKREKINASFKERVGMVGLLILKSLTMTLGRIYGSIRYRVVCI
ncbi:TPA: glycosyltransferase [Candidatus Bathyarchaeota archaeon]|nr:glycosyltransferase [Candidatus Bathyarchaeota archaeon]